MDENYTQNNQYDPNVQYNVNPQYGQQPAQQYGQNPQYAQNQQYGQQPAQQYGQNPQYAQNQQYMQNQQNIQNLQTQQSNQIGMQTPKAEGDKDFLENPEQAWKAAIGIGILNVVLSILCGSFRIRIMSAGLIILLLAGVYGSYMSIKGGLAKRKSIAVLMGIIAMVINVAATGYYIWSIIYTIGSKFS